MKTNNNQIKAQLDSINEKLDAIESHMVWSIKPESRFNVGQRVEWSRRGRKNGFPSRKVAQKGTVKEINGFSVVVKLDGLKQPRSFHHGFFNPVNGLKLF